VLLQFSGLLNKTLTKLSKKNYLNHSVTSAHRAESVSFVLLGPDGVVPLVLILGILIESVPEN
jgi:hypothetical protein